MVRLRECIELYDGAGDVASWLRKFEEIAASQGIDSIDKHVPCLLAKGANAVNAGIPAADNQSWKR